MMWSGCMIVLVVVIFVIVVVGLVGGLRSVVVVGAVVWMMMMVVLMTSCCVLRRAVVKVEHQRVEGYWVCGLSTVQVLLCCCQVVWRPCVCLLYDSLRPCLECTQVRAGCL